MKTAVSLRHWCPTEIYLFLKKITNCCSTTVFKQHLYIINSHTHKHNISSSHSMLLYHYHQYNMWKSRFLENMKPVTIASLLVLFLARRHLNKLVKQSLLTYLPNILTGKINNAVALNKMHKMLVYEGLTAMLHER